MTSSTETSGILPDQSALPGIASRENRIQAVETGSTGGTMSESSDARRQQPSYPEHVTSDDRDGIREEARRWVRRKRIFYTIVGVYLALSLMWFVIDMLDDSSGLWFYWPMLGAGLAVVVVGLAMFGLGGLFGADWERRQVDRYLERRSDRRSGPDAPS
jgi:2TM domain